VFVDVRRRGTRDRRDQERRNALLGGDWFCHTAYVYIQTEGASRRTHLYGAVVMGTNNAHLNVAARALSHRYGSPGFAWFSCSQDKGECSTTPSFAVDIDGLCTMSWSRRLKVGALDGEAKSEGETEEEADVTG
jgi:hypothetical protein